MKVDEIARKRLFTFPDEKRPKQADLSKGKKLELDLLDKNSQPCHLVGVVSRVDTYPASQVVNFKTTWQEVFYKGELVINFEEPQLDGVVLKYDCANKI